MATQKSNETPNTTTAGGSCVPQERDFWTSLGLPYCEKCCNPRATDLSGQTICRLEEPETCPLMNNTQ